MNGHVYLHSLTIALHTHRETEKLELIQQYGPSNHLGSKNMGCIHAAVPAIPRSDGL